MSRWIDADALIEKIANKFYDEAQTVEAFEMVNKVCDFISDIPSIGIVRCKDCRFGTWFEKVGEYSCILHDQDLFRAEHFCAYGERKE